METTEKKAFHQQKDSSLHFPTTKSQKSQYLKHADSNSTSLEGLGTPEDWSIPFVSLAKDFLSQCGTIDESQNTSFSSAGLGNYHSSTLDLLPSLALLDETCPMVGNTMGMSLFHIVPL